MREVFILVLAILSFAQSMAQKSFEGRIHYTVEYTSFPDGMEGVELALPQQMTLLVMGESYRMLQSSALAGDLIVIKPAGVDTIYQLFDFMGKQVYLAIAKNTQAPKYRIMAKEEAKEIAERTTKKRFLQASDGRSQEAWVDEKFLNPLVDEFPSLRHMPLQFEMDRNGIQMRFTAKSIHEQPLDDTYFSIPTNAVRIDPDILQRIMN